MTEAAYLTARETWRKLHLPDDLGRCAWEMWRMQPSFPKPVEWARDRWFFPAVEQWLMGYHGVRGGAVQAAPIPLAGNKGETFNEAFAARQAKAAKRSKRAGPDLSPTGKGMGPVMGAAVGPDEARLSRQDGKVVAFRRDAAPAD